MNRSHFKLRSVLVLPFLTLVACQPNPPKSTIYFDSALQTAAWLESVSIESQDGLAWPANPEKPDELATNLYSGSPGVVLFYLDLHKATRDEKHLKMAIRGGEYLLQTLPDTLHPGQTGLYTGVAGVGFVFSELFRATGKAKFRDGADRCVSMLAKSVKRIGDGVEWNEVSDIVGGLAGTGLFLLYADEHLKSDAALELATKAGNRLLDLAEKTDDGLKWAMTPSFARLMPNFSHGTAGNGYFLAALFERTKNEAFLNAAISGAEYLTAVSEKSDSLEGFIFHHEPEGEDLFYLGWCHGPPGTSRLFYKLYQITGEAAWLEPIKTAAETIVQSGVPEKQTPGFWNNVSQCCGSAGLAEFYLALHRVFDDERYLVFAKRIADNLIERSNGDGSGLKWIQAEHRVRPELLIAQTGYMQGAAGIGMMLLRMDVSHTQRHNFIVFPDNPF